MAFVQNAGKWAKRAARRGLCGVVAVCILPMSAVVGRPALDVDEASGRGAGATATVVLFGACCINASTCFQNASPNNCYDLGGIWQGDGTTCAQVTCVNPPVCPGGGMVEGEPNCGQPAPDNFNSGCFVIGGAFFALQGHGCGQVICATASADLRNGGFAGRDSDYYYFAPQSTTRFQACVEAQFHAQVELIELGHGVDPCVGTSVRESRTGTAGEPLCIERCVLQGVPHAVAVTTVDAFGQPLREGIACAPYVLRTQCAACANGACCMDETCVSGIFGSGQYAGETVSRPNCEAQGGVYLGDGVDCVGADCRAACCLPEGTCSSMGRASCLAAFGAWHPGQECVDVPPCAVCLGEDPNDADNDGTQDEDCSFLPPLPVNSGCDTNAPGTAFTPIACGQTVCGSTAFDGFDRDFDWYHINIAQTTDARFTITNQTGAQMIFLARWYSVQSGLPACPSGPDDMRELLGPTALTTVPVDATVTIPLVLAPGRYTLLLSHRVNPLGPPTPLECPAAYRVAVSCITQTCAFACEPGSVMEAEAACGAAGQMNAGCFDPSQPGAFSAITVGQRSCGTTRLVRGETPQGFATLDRDFDWWRITLPFAGEWVISLQSDFHALVHVHALDGEGFCDATPLVVARVPRCGAEPAQIRLENPAAGDYAILVTPEAEFYRTALLGDAAAPGTEELCPAHYQLQVILDGEACGGIACADSNLNGAVSVGDIGAFVAALSGGFSSWESGLAGVQTQVEFLCANDTDGNGVISVGDIARFLSSVVAGESQCAVGR